MVDVLLAEECLELFVRQPLFGEIAGKGLALVDEQRRRAFEDQAKLSASISQHRDEPTQGNEDCGQKQASGQRVVAAVHRVLNGVADEEQRYELGGAHPAKLAFAT